MSKKNTSMLNQNFPLYVILLLCINSVAAATVTDSASQWTTESNSHWTLSETSSVCPGDVGWTYFSLHCYRLFTYEFVYSDRTWTTAQNQCRTHGGRLVSINSANEAYSVSNMLKTYGKAENLYVWIGLTDYEREGQFRWVDGTNLTNSTYTAWDKGFDDVTYTGSAGQNKMAAAAVFASQKDLTSTIYEAIKRN